MKKILIGICGFGNGHINRQICLIEWLRQLQNQIVVVTTKDKEAYLKKLFPELKVITVIIPWIICGTKGIDFVKTLSVYSDNEIDQYKHFLEKSIEIQSSFGGENPDIVFTDYEPTVAQFAYATNIPLICFEQQSKFLLFEEKKTLGKYSIMEEIYRLNYFFPKSERKIISSFFNLENVNKGNATIIPPIIRHKKRGEKVKKAIVYFSPYAKSTEMYEAILEQIKTSEEYIFCIYTDKKFSKYENNNNFRFKEYGIEFDDDLYDCAFIISSAGHQLISEAIDLEIPLYLCPLETFEQNYNCSKVEEYGLGVRRNEGTKEELDQFIASIDNFEKNMRTYKKTVWVSDWKESLKEIMEEIL